MSASDSDWRDSIPKDVLLKQWNPILCNKCFSPSKLYSSPSPARSLLNIREKKTLFETLSEFAWRWRARVFEHYVTHHFKFKLESWIAMLLELIASTPRERLWDHLICVLVNWDHVEKAPKLYFMTNSKFGRNTLDTHCMNKYFSLIFCKKYITKYHQFEEKRA